MEVEKDLVLKQYHIYNKVKSLKEHYQIITYKGKFNVRENKTTVYMDPFKNEIDKTYATYEQILFYKNDDVVNQFKTLKNLPNKKNKETIQENKNNKKSFLLLALKSIYDENSKIQFLSDNINHEHIQSIPKEKLSIEEIQKNLFEQFLGEKLEHNIHKATALRQNLEENNNIKLRF